LCQSRVSKYHHQYAINLDNKSVPAISSNPMDNFLMNSVIKFNTVAH